MSWRTELVDLIGGGGDLVVKLALGLAHAVLDRVGVNLPAEAVDAIARTAATKALQVVHNYAADHLLTGSEAQTREAQQKALAALSGVMTELALQLEREFHDAFKAKGIIPPLGIPVEEVTAEEYARRKAAGELE